MSRSQKATLWLGALAIASLCLYVPWTEGIHSYAYGYGFLFLPPKPGLHVDTTRFLIPVVAVAVLTAMLTWVGPSWRLPRLSWWFDQKTHRGRFLSAVGVLLGGMVGLAGIGGVVALLDSGPQKTRSSTKTASSLRIAR